MVSSLFHMSTTTSAPATITTATGSRYLFDGVELTRLSERPIGHIEDVVVAGERVSFAAPVVVGMPWVFHLADGRPVVTSAVVSVEPT